MKARRNPHRIGPTKGWIICTSAKASRAAVISANTRG
jgi:hypothetical protein